MLITGYHGTTEIFAHNILAEGEYHISCGDKEWLGDGIYFYEKFSDAYGWRPESEEKRRVLHSVIEVEDRKYFDIDSQEGEKAWGEIIDYICKSENIELTDSYQENQCAVCRMLWDANPEIKVLAASFATDKSKIKVLIDKRKRRREFCVRDNSSIRCTQIIEYYG